MELELTNLTNISLSGGRKWYHECCRNSKELIITVGDSWTWGDSLGKTTLEFDDYSYRTSKIYGNCLSEKLGHDFINIGIPGGSNLNILTYVEQVLKSLTKTYKDICIIFTLTESGRELRDSFLNHKLHYNSWAGKDWASFEDILNGNENESQRNLMFDEIKGTEFEHIVGLYIALRDSTSLVDLLTRYEKYTVDSIRQRIPGIKLARNFTSIIDNNDFDVKKRWTDIIAINGKLTNYPENAYVVSGMGVDPLIQLSQHLDANHFKNEWLQILDSANQCINWLSNSPYNSSIATKHPQEQAHQWWAEYLYESVLKWKQKQS